MLLLSPKSHSPYPTFFLFSPTLLAEGRREGGAYRAPRGDGEYRKKEGAPSGEFRPEFRGGRRAE